MFLIHSRISFFRNVRKWKNCVNWIENKKKKINKVVKLVVAMAFAAIIMVVLISVMKNIGG